MKKVATYTLSPVAYISTVKEERLEVADVHVELLHLGILLGLDQSCISQYQALGSQEKRKRTLPRLDPCWASEGVEGADGAFAAATATLSLASSSKIWQIFLLVSFTPELSEIVRTNRRLDRKSVV